MLPQGQSPVVPTPEGPRPPQPKPPEVNAGGLVVEVSQAPEVQTEGIVAETEKAVSSDSVPKVAAQPLETPIVTPESPVIEEEKVANVAKGALSQYEDLEKTAGSAFDVAFGFEGMDAKDAAELGIKEDSVV